MVLCPFAQHAWLFFLSRGVVGIGTASYSTIAPTVLGDLFVRDQRTCVLAIFYLFIPVGRLVFTLDPLPWVVTLRPKGVRTRPGPGGGDVKAGRPGFEPQLSPFLTGSLYLSEPLFLYVEMGPVTPTDKLRWGLEIQNKDAPYWPVHSREG